MIFALFLPRLVSMTDADVPRITLLPDRPSPYEMRDWKQVGTNFDRFVFDGNNTGKNLPLIWRVPNTPNLKVPGFGIPSYVGNESQRGQVGEGICCMGALLGASALGIDKSAGPVDWISLSEEFYNPIEKLVLNNPGARTGGTFWYELLPSIDFTQLSQRYPNWTRGRQISREIADTWIKGTNALGGNFDHTSFSFQLMKPVDNGLWKEPDAAAAVAYLELFEGLRSGNEKYLQTARKALGSLQKRQTNPTYEVLTAYGALAGAYLNAEKGEHWDVHRFVNWCFDPTSPNRPGWGMVAGQWGGYDSGGLMGSVSDSAGYAFAMNTFLNAATLAPVARYDSRLSATIGKWILNLANAARLYYRNGLPPAFQSSANWTADKTSCIAYEGLRHTWDSRSPFATGDAKRGNASIEDFGLYGAGYVGLLGALVTTTDVPMILSIDLRATDFLPVKGYPTHLFWNPYDSTKVVHFDVGQQFMRPYDSVTGKFLSSKPVHGSFAVRLGAKQAIQLVSVPLSATIRLQHNHRLAGNVVIDYRPQGKVVCSTSNTRPQDVSKPVRVDYASMPFGEMTPWQKLKSDVISLGPSPGGSLSADLQFAWDKQYLYFHLDQRSPGLKNTEAKAARELVEHPWDFDNVVLNFDPSRGDYPIVWAPEITVGWSSVGAQGLGVCPDMLERAIQTTTAGNAVAANRAVWGRVPWRAIQGSVGSPAFRATQIHAGLKIGCQPLLTDGNYEHQSYIGGARYTRPTGFDMNSRTLVLAGPESK